MIDPELADVRPRVVSPDTGDPVLLDDYVRELVSRVPSAAIRITGPEGSGKTTALCHLASIFHDHATIALLDDPETKEAISQSGYRYVVFATRRAKAAIEPTLQLQMAKWTLDDLIEYWMRRHRDLCQVLLSRWQRLPDTALADGNAELMVLITDHLAESDRLRSVREILGKECRNRAIDAKQLDEAREVSYLWNTGHLNLAISQLARVMKVTDGRKLAELLRHRCVRNLLATEQIAQKLEEPASDLEFLRFTMPEDLIREVHDALCGNQTVVDRLHDIVHSSRRMIHSMAASLLVGLDPTWIPDPEQALWLGSAHLPNVEWPRASLQSCDLQGANLNRANLSEANLNDADLISTRLRHANLQRAKVRRANFYKADLHRADLRDASASHADFGSADLSHARLQNANLQSARICAANLSNAQLNSANLKFAQLVRVNLAGADLTSANCERASFDGIVFGETILEATNFRRVTMWECDLEYVRLESPDFRQAHLHGVLLTGSVMTSANFRKADLSGSGLAEVSWECADLQGADFTNCSFHLGSSRSGLVGSIYPCEGSRTGFYTDDYDEQHFKAPEEIRKANLRGADLRGAVLGSTDFYLVDLRDAMYDRRQENHLRQCGAIL